MKTTKIKAIVKQRLGDGSSGCHGYWGVYEQHGGSFSPVRIDIPEGVGADAELEIEITVRVVSKGKRRTTKCENPWPGHKAVCKLRKSSRSTASVKDKA